MRTLPLHHLMFLGGIAFLACSEYDAPIGMDEGGASGLGATSSSGGTSAGSLASAGVGATTSAGGRSGGVGRGGAGSGAEAGAGGVPEAGAANGGTGGDAAAGMAGNSGTGAAGGPQFPPGIVGKESSLWGPKGADWDPAGPLPDFSWAGYHSSDIPLPTVQQVANLRDTGALPDDGADDSKKLQQLIDAQAARPLKDRGAILIPRGRWNLASPISLSVSGVVLRGETDAQGRPVSEFYIDPPYDAPNVDGTKDFYIAVKGSLKLSAVASVTQAAKQGAKTFTINYTGATKLAAGNYIRLAQKEPADQSLSKYLHGFDVPASAETAALGQNKDGLYFKWYAKVVSTNGNQITVDRPVPIDVRLAWAPQIALFDVAGSTSEMGLEHLAITFNHNKNYVHLDWWGANAISLSGVTNSWVRNVKLTNSDYGVLVTGLSCFNTITRIAVEDSLRSVAIPERTAALQDEAKWVYAMQQRGTGHHPLYATNSHFNLFQNFDFEYINWHETSVELGAAYNVFRNGKGVAMAFDNHRHMPYSNLWTNIDIGRPERIYWNSGQPERGPNAGIRNTYWNISYAGGKLPAAPGGAAGFRQLNLIGIVSARAGDPSQTVEVTGEKERVMQPDLFQAQLDKRHGP